MTSKKITDADVAKLKVSSLPSRPTAPRSFGGAGFTAADMKAAFDRLPMYIISRFNELIDDVGREGEGGLAAEIPTGIKDSHTLADMMADVTTGAFSAYLTVLGAPLTEAISSLREKMAEISESATGSATDAKLSAQKVEEFEAMLEEFGITLDTVAAAVAECTEAHAAIAQEHGTDISALRASIEDLSSRANSLLWDIEEYGERLTVVEGELIMPSNMIIDCGGAADIS